MSVFDWIVLNDSVFLWVQVKQTVMAVINYPNVLSNNSGVVCITEVIPCICSCTKQ